MRVELLVGVAFGFLGGMITAWRIAAKGAVLAWLDDLRDVVEEYARPTAARSWRSVTRSLTRKLRHRPRRSNGS